MIYNTILIISFFILCWIPELEAIAKWYYYNKGAEHWCEVSDNCCGKRQSPIHLYPDPNTISQTEYPFKFIDYDKVPKAMKMTNNGHTVEIAIVDDAVQPRLSGGGLPYTYKFHSFHFHWGSQLTNGSEHTLIGSRYPMEVHLLHYNENFTDIVAAQKSGADAAFAVLAVFIDKSNSGNPYILSLTEKLKEVKYMDDETNITQPFPLNVLLPRVMKKFYRYMGSLTTPGCNEIVVWNIFVTPIYLSQSQMKKFWDLHAEIKGDEPHPLEDNYRPIQSRHDRKVSIIWLRR